MENVATVELSAQVLALGYPDLATTLHQLIHDQPRDEELHIGLEIGERLIEGKGSPLRR